MSEKISKNATKLHAVVKAADSLTLGIQIVVSILTGVGLGVGAMKLFGGVGWLFGGVALGVAAAINCVYKVYLSEKQSYAELKEELDKTASDNS